MTAESIVVPVVDNGLGNSAYLVDLGDGRALAVDPTRDLRALRAVAERRGLDIAFAAETHLHADFVSGGRELAATDNTRLLGSAGGGREFPHTGLRDGDEVDLGGLVLRALGTPGHTPEHLSYLLLDGDRTIGVFTGGSLIVGGAARTDLVSAARTEELARAQFASLHRLLSLDDGVPVWPTHGAGSFCSTPSGMERTSTIGREKARNPLLQAPDADAFAESLISSLGSFPSYFLRLAEVNRRGPAVIGEARLTPLDAGAVHRLATQGAQLVDVRPIPDFAQDHIPGSLSIALRDAFASWAGWLLDPDAPVVFIRNDDQDPDEIVWQALKVGVERLAGELSGGMAAWREAGHPVSSIPLAGPEQLAGSTVLDVRQDSEFTGGHLPGALHVELGALTGAGPELPEGPLTTMCGHGERAMSAASLLARTGRRDLTVLVGGADDWARTTGGVLEAGA